MATTTPQQDDQQGHSEHLAAHEGDFYASFRRDYPLTWLLTLVGPPLGTVALLVVIGIVAGWKFVRNLAVTGVFTFFFFGKFVILGGNGHAPEGTAEFLTNRELFFMVVYMDVMTAMLLVCHAGFLFRIPYLGKRLLSLAEDGQFILKLHPWMRRATFVGMVGFVMFPLAATGAVGGAIFGRLLGMSRISTFLGICLGSVLGCALMFYGSKQIDLYLDRDNPLNIIAGIGIIVALILLLNHRYRDMKRRAGH